MLNCSNLYSLLCKVKSTLTNKVSYSDCTDLFFEKYKLLITIKANFLIFHTNYNTLNN